MSRNNFKLKNNAEIVACFICEYKHTFATQEPCKSCTICHLDGLQKIQLKEKIVELIQGTYKSR